MKNTVERARTAERKKARRKRAGHGPPRGAWGQPHAARGTGLDLDLDVDDGLGGSLAGDLRGDLESDSD